MLTILGKLMAEEEPFSLTAYHINFDSDESFRISYKYEQKLHRNRRFLLWICIRIFTALITFVANLWTAKTSDPNICISDMDRRSVIIISLILGSSGADRFYLGHVVSGCIKCLSGGLYDVWWVVDLVMISMGVLYDTNGCVFK